MLVRTPPVSEREEAMADETEVPTLEWWPDYGGDLLWSRFGQGGRRVTMAEVGLSAAFQERAASWLESYEDAKLPIDGNGDADWLAAGTRLLENAHRTGGTIRRDDHGAVLGRVERLLSFSTTRARSYADRSSITWPAMQRLVRVRRTPVA